MDIKKVHNALKSSGKDLPIIAFTSVVWKKQIEAFSAEYFGSLSSELIDSPLTGIYADLEVLSLSPIVDYSGENEIVVKNYEVQFTLKTKENPKSYISQHRIVFRSIVFTVTTIDGGVYLQGENGDYLSYPPLLNNDDERELNFHSLREKYEYSDEQIVYFINKQEAIAGFLVANDLLETFKRPFKIIDFSVMFPKIMFSGDFMIRKVFVDGEELITFEPESFERKEPTQCEVDSQSDRVIGTGTFENGEFRVGGGTYSSRSVGKYPSPSDAKMAEIYLFLPKSASEKLVSPQGHDRSNKSRNILAKSRDNWEMPPFLFSHKIEISVEDNVSISWDGLSPCIEIKAGCYLDFYLKAWIKVFRIKTSLATVKNANQYEINYKGKLIELYNGDLGLVGELWDPTNFTITDFRLDTILPDTLDRVASRILRGVLEPIIRAFITKLVVSATWPLISKAIFYALGGDGAALGQGGGGRRPDVLPKIELANYFSDLESATLGVSRRLEDVG